MDVIEEIIKNKEELFLKLIKVMQGKQTEVKLNLDGVRFSVGDITLKLKGNVEVSVIPAKGKSRTRG
jgi:hypothetical protein